MRSARFANAPFVRGVWGGVRLWGLEGLWRMGRWCWARIRVVVSLGRGGGCVGGIMSMGRGRGVCRGDVFGGGVG